MPPTRAVIPLGRGWARGVAQFPSSRSPPVVPLVVFGLLVVSRLLVAFGLLVASGLLVAFRLPVASGLPVVFGLVVASGLLVVSGVRQLVEA